MRLLLLVTLLCAGCATNIGRALGTAFSGTPEEVVSAVQFVDQRMKRELREKYDAIESASVTKPDGSIDSVSAENRFRDMEFYNAELERWEDLSAALANYLGVSIQEDPNSSEKRADKRRKEFWEALLKGARESKDKLEEIVNDPR